MLLYKGAEDQRAMRRSTASALMAGLMVSAPLMATRPAPSAKSRMALSSRPLRVACRMPAMVASPAPMKKRQGLFRYETLMKLVRTKHTAAVIDAIYTLCNERRRSEMGNVEINPVDMF